MRFHEHLKMFEALVVIIGVSVAFYELYFNDRLAQQQARVELERRSFEVASEFFNYDAMAPFIAMAVRYNNSDEQEIYEQASVPERKKIEDQILISGFPILFKIAEIDACLSHGLCSEDIVLDMTCTPLIGVHSEFEALSRRYAGVSQLTREKPLRRMMSRCLEAAERT